MGRRDYRHREPKKPKKDAQKPSVQSILPAPATVEEVKSRRKKRELESEEEE